MRYMAKASALVVSSLALKDYPPASRDDFVQALTVLGARRGPRYSHPAFEKDERGRESN
jgi:hypothetical protein